jgi:hypothetical protein
MTARIVADDTAGREAAVAVLEAGGVVAIPTDTVYGICVSLATVGGIERLFAIKRRPPDKSIALLLADPSGVLIAVLSGAATALAEACWRRPDVAWRSDRMPVPRGADRRCGHDRAARAGPSGAARSPQRSAVADDLGQRAGRRSPRCGRDPAMLGDGSTSFSTVGRPTAARRRRWWTARPTYRGSCGRGR